MKTQQLALLAVLVAAPLLVAADEGFVDTFDVPKTQFTSTGKNAYFNLEPGYQMTFEGKEDGHKMALVITVLDETKTVDGVETRIVEERETSDGKPIEISRNYFALDMRNNDVYYFGEDVDMYKNGKVSGHEGGWLAGEKGAKFGLAMPAAPKVGQKYYQEIAPKQAMDRAEVTSIDEKVKVPAGTFERCVKTVETTPIEPDEHETKIYAPNVGLLGDGPMKLIKYGMKQR